MIGGTGFYDRWEIRDILSYLRVLADPADDLAAARILRSRRWRLGGRELFHLGQWVQRENGSRGRNAEGRPKPARLHLLDAVLSHDRVKGLSSEARSRLDALGQELRGYAQMRQQAPLAELVTHVVERTGYRRELLAQPGFDARVALLNLEKLEEMARQFGAGGTEASLADFVEFVGYALDSGEEESEVRPIDEETDTVKVMTIHQAKGLEFPVVFIPGLPEKIFPTPGRDEADKWYELPWALRGDRDHVPGIDLTIVMTERDLKRAIESRKEAEKAHWLDEERRLFYVAITRAERQLYLTRAHWYYATTNPRQASPFWDIVAGSRLSRDLGEEECPAENPNTAWTTSGSGQAPDKALERDGDLAALLLSGEDPGGWIEATAQREGYGRWTVLRAEVDTQVEALGLERRPEIDAERIDVSCSALILYLACPRHYRYVYVDRLPARPSPAAAIGREAHRRLEELCRQAAVSLRQPTRQETPDEDDAQVPEGRLEEILDTATQRTLAALGHRKVDDLVARFRESVYGSRAATFVEAPFRLLLRGGSLTGRIDRLDQMPSGDWELVDFKSGAPAAEAAGVYRRQLALYTLAVRDIRRVPAERISAHLFCLQDGSDLALSFTDADLDSLKQEVETALLAIAQSDFPAAARSPLCERCHYHHLCLAAMDRSFGTATEPG